MKILLDSIVFEVDDALLSPGSLLHTLLHTKITNVEKEGDAFVISDVTIEGMVSYLDFLNFRTDFEWNETIASDFDYLGHSNLLQYPLDFWKVKLIDDRVREFFSTHPQKQLIKLNAQEKRIEEILETLGLIGDDFIQSKDLYIAGGAALYIAGITDIYHDIDIFTCNRKAAEEIIQHIIDAEGNYPVYSDHAVSFKGLAGYKQVQLILREYSCPSEIVHGFDLGSCSVIFDGTDVWTTVKGEYCFKEKVNWFEPDRSSPTYALRLAKYHCRGFKIMLPMTNSESGSGVCINRTEVRQIEDKVLDVYYNIVCKDEGDNDQFNIDHSEEVEIKVEDLDDLCDRYIECYAYGDRIWGLIKRIKRMLEKEVIKHVLVDYPELTGEGYEGLIENLISINNGKISYKTLFDFANNPKSKSDENDWGIVRICGAYQLYSKYMLEPNANPIAVAISYLKSKPSMIEYKIDEIRAGYRRGDINKLEEDIQTIRDALTSSYPTDPMSILILTGVLGYQPSVYLTSKRINASDYASTTPKHLTNLNQLQWKTVNPMEQLTGTFYPTPIVSDVMDFYLSSPLVMKGESGIQTKPFYKTQHFKFVHKSSVLPTPPHFTIDLPLPMMHTFSPIMKTSITIAPNVYLPKPTFNSMRPFGMLQPPTIPKLNMSPTHAPQYPARYPADLGLPKPPVIISDRTILLDRYPDINNYTIGPGHIVYYNPDIKTLFQFPPIYVGVLDTTTGMIRPLLESENKYVLAYAKYDPTLMPKLRQSDEE